MKLYSWSVSRLLPSPHRVWASSDTPLYRYFPCSSPLRLSRPAFGLPQTPPSTGTILTLKSELLTGLKAIIYNRSNGNDYTWVGAARWVHLCSTLCVRPTMKRWPPPTVWRRLDTGRSGSAPGRYPDSIIELNQSYYLEFFSFHSLKIGAQFQKLPEPPGKNLGINRNKSMPHLKQPVAPPVERG